MLDSVDLLVSLTLVGTSFLTALCALLLVDRVFRRPKVQTLADTPAASQVFLFDGRGLRDATPRAQRVFQSLPDQGDDLARLLSHLEQRFPGIAEDFRSIPDGQSLSRPGASAEDGRVEIERRGESARIAVFEPEDDGVNTGPDRETIKAMGRELEALRGLANGVPVPLWHQSPGGEVTWANRAYLDLTARLHGESAVACWPPEVLIDGLDTNSLPEPGRVRRVEVSATRGGTARWFELSATRAGSGHLLTAIPADRVIEAERGLRDFMQTLTKTFADITVGLAIFDRERQLQLFNPALTDLLGLPVEFLAARPTLLDVLDQLRERRRIPEPKNYADWRDRLARLEAEAAGGTFQETWTLPGGDTLRVTGRPHPDGAVAFLFEDISAELQLTRRFRSELDLGQAVVDSLDEAVAVFGPDGVLALSNRAYSALFGTDPSTGLRDVGVLEASRTWLAATAPTPVWGDVREFLMRRQDRAAWCAEVRLRDGRPMVCRLQPLPGGACLIGFRPGEALDRDSAPALAHMGGL